MVFGILINHFNAIISRLCYSFRVLRFIVRVRVSVNPVNKLFIFLSSFRIIPLYFLFMSILNLHHCNSWLQQLHACRDSCTCRSWNCNGCSGRRGIAAGSGRESMSSRKKDSNFQESSVSYLCFYLSVFIFLLL